MCTSPWASGGLWSENKWKTARQGVQWGQQSPEPPGSHCSHSAPGTGASPSGPTWALSVGADRTQHGGRAPALTQEESQNAEVRGVTLVPEEGRGKEEGSEEESEGNCLYFKNKLFNLE